MVGDERSGWGARELHDVMLQCLVFVLSKNLSVHIYIITVINPSQDGWRNDGRDDARSLSVLHSIQLSCSLLSSQFSAVSHFTIQLHSARVVVQRQEVWRRRYRSKPKKSRIRAQSDRSITILQQLHSRCFTMWSCKSNFVHYHHHHHFEFK